MRITRMEIDGEMYEVTKSTLKEATYCNECDLNDKCTKKDVVYIPCAIIDEEDVFKKI